MNCLYCNENLTTTQDEHLQTCSVIIKERIRLYSNRTSRFKKIKSIIKWLFTGNN